jgi:hypothetical protein
MSITRLLSLLFVIVLTTVVNANEQFVNNTELIANDGAPDDRFGVVTATTGSRVVVSAPDANGEGAVYVYELQSTWQQTAKLTASDGTAGDQFGHDVDIDGDVIVVGAVGQANDTGAIYIYTWDGMTWVETKRTKPGGGVPGERFGDSVNIQQDTILVGIPTIQRVQIYRNYFGEGWQPDNFIQPTEPADGFGNSVDFDGNRVIVGAPFDDTTVTDGGAVFVFALSGSLPTQIARLTAADAAPDDPNVGPQLGTAVAISGDRVLASAPYQAGGGAAYIFRQRGGTWSQTHLPATNDSPQDQYGYSLTIAGEVLLVGAPGTNNAAGAVYVYRQNDGVWIAAETLTLLNPTAGDRLGASVAARLTTIIAGAPGVAAETGAAYTFKNNRVPMPVIDSYTTPYNTMLSVAAPGVLENDTDPDGDDLTAVPASGDTQRGGLYTLQADGAFTYQPPTDYSGADSFIYTATDDFGLSAQQTVLLSIGETQTRLFPTDGQTLDTRITRLAWAPVIGQSWYHVVLVNTAGTVVLDRWVEAAQACTVESCITPINGLTNGVYDWWLASYSDGTGVSNYTMTSFSLNAPSPAAPENITVAPNQGRPTLTWTDSPAALWYQLYIYGGEQTFDRWYFIEDVCAEGTCTVEPAIDWPAGTYAVWMRSWGPGGFSADWNQGPDLVLADTPAAAPSALAFASADSITWTAGANSTWYQLTISPTDDTWTWDMGWFPAADLGCVAPAATCTYTNADLTQLPAGDYTLAARAWGPGGLSAFAEVTATP